MVKRSITPPSTRRLIRLCIVEGETFSSSPMAGEGSVAVLAQLSDYVNIRFVQISLKFRAH